MALFEKVTIIDARGKEHVVEAGAFSSIQIKQGDQAVCVVKENVFGLAKETTYIQNPPSPLIASR